MRFAYADPPYPGNAKLYKDHPDYAGEVDHQALIARLVMKYPDGWVLHTGSNNLKEVLALCPAGVRVMAWVKPFASFKPNVNPAYAWEPVIVSGGRRYARYDKTIRDWVSCNITLKKGLTGAKPEAVCHWLFSVLHALPEDTMDDLFPGTGAVSRAWETWCEKFTLEQAA